MVKRIEIAIDSAVVCGAIKSARLVRNEAGAWTMTITLDGEIKIDADRSLRIDGDVRIRGRQRGRAKKVTIKGKKS
jgi:hypothetical protein